MACILVLSASKMKSVSRKPGTSTQFISSDRQLPHSPRCLGVGFLILWDRKGALRLPSRCFLAEHCFARLDCLNRDSFLSAWRHQECSFLVGSFQTQRRVQDSILLQLMAATMPQLLFFKSFFGYKMEWKHSLSRKLFAFTLLSRSYSSLEHFFYFSLRPYRADQPNGDASESSRSIQSVILTPNWMYFSLFMTSGILRFSYYIGSVAAQIEYLSDWDETVAEDYISLFGTMLPFGVFVTPIAGLLLDKYGTSTLLWIVYVLIAVQGMLSAITSLPLQRASFICFVVFRSFFFFTVVTKWCSEVFPTKHIGKAFGLASTVASMLTLGAQVLLFDLAASKEGSYLLPNIIVLCITSIIGLLLPVYWIWMVHDDGSALESELAQI